MCSIALVFVSFVLYVAVVIFVVVFIFFFFQAEDGIRDLVRSRGLGDVYKRQVWPSVAVCRWPRAAASRSASTTLGRRWAPSATSPSSCLLYTSDAADERSSVDLGGRRIIKKKNRADIGAGRRSKIKTQTKHPL